ncbi:MAG: HAMP domain-containing sensor histidine kinase [Mariprofundaceae bacterium]
MQANSPRRPGAPAFSLRRLLRSSAYFLASFFALAVFLVALVLAESTFYAITGHSVSTWSMILAALVAAAIFTPLTQRIQRITDRIFFRRHLDMLSAMRELCAEGLAAMPAAHMEQHLLERLCQVSKRQRAALDDRSQPDGRIYCHPEQSEPPPASAETPPLWLEKDAGYELCLSLPRQQGEMRLYLGPHADGKATEADEIPPLQAMARFAAMSLEHARLSRQQAENARLDSIHRVVGQLNSHDLKNRLHDLAFLAHNLEEGNLEPADSNQLVEAIRRVVGRIQVLMNRLADPEAPLDPQMQAVDAARLIRGCLDGRMWPEGVHFHVDEDALPAVRGDADMLRSVFDNIIENAVQAMQGGGDVFIHYAVEHDGVTVAIRDTGCGMDAEFLRYRLFQLFVTSKPSGLGIGMYLVRRIIEAHQGGVEATSAGRGKGCTFQVNLPLWQPEARKAGIRI